MLLEDIHDATDLIQYLREFIHWQSDNPPYDESFVLHMLLAVLDNLHTRGFEPDIENVGEVFNDEQRKMIAEISKYANSITDAEVAEIWAREEAEENSNQVT